MTLSDHERDELLREQVRLLKKSDKRGGCLWNLVMTLVFGPAYLGWLFIKRLAKWTIAVVKLAWRIAIAGARWAWNLAHKLLAKARSRNQDSL